MVEVALAYAVLAFAAVVEVVLAFAVLASAALVGVALQIEAERLLQADLVETSKDCGEGRPKKKDVLINI